MTIEFENVHKSFRLKSGKRHVVYEALNLKIPGRPYVGILGRNGAGKSTLIRMLAGLEPPDRGRVICDGLISPPLGLQAGLSAGLSGRDNAKFVCRIRGDSLEAMRERLEYIREFAELGDFWEQRVRNYSSGMKARLALGIAMAYHYDYYLIDELTAVGDEKFRRRTEAVLEVKRQEAGLFLVSHSMATLRAWCSAGLYARKGELLYFERIDDAIAAYQKDN